jgi:hypothetical protein
MGALIVNVYEGTGVNHTYHQILFKSSNFESKCDAYHIGGKLLLVPSAPMILSRRSSSGV